MCLAIPGRVSRKSSQTGPAMGERGFGGPVRKGMPRALTEAGIGDYVIVHVGLP